MRTFRSIFAFLAAALLAVACRGEKPQTSFDGTAALAYAKTQLDFGTRIPNSLGAQRAGDWIVAQMKTRADTVIEQKWDHVTVKGDTLHLRNILARIHPAAAQRVLYLTHWDTRPDLGSARDPAQRNAPMPGANDGASGVALFMALGDALKKTPANVGVDLLFVDGEDYGDFGTMKDVLLGSTYFASHLPSPDYKPLYARALRHDRRQGSRHLPGAELARSAPPRSSRSCGTRRSRSATRATSSTARRTRA